MRQAKLTDWFGALSLFQAHQGSMILIYLLLPLDHTCLSGDLCGKVVMFWAGFRQSLGAWVTQLSSDSLLPLAPHGPEWY